MCCAYTCVCVFLQGHAVYNSYVQAGTLLEASHLPVYCMTEPRLSNTSSMQRLERTTTSLLTGLRQQCTDTSHQQSIADNVTVAVCGASLAGGWDDDNDLSDYVELSSDIDVDKFVVDRLLATAQTIVDCGASVLACQKVNTVLYLQHFLISGVHLPVILWHFKCVCLCGELVNC